MDKSRQFSLVYFAIVLLLVAAMQDYLRPQHLNNVPYSDFRSLLQAGKVKRVSLT